MQPARNPVVPQPRIQDGRMLFPEVLHSMVEYCDKHHNQVLCWMDDGNGFVVKDRRFFEFHILPLYFRHGRFGSLERQLANYGFRRDGRGVGYYRHEQNLFQRDRPELASSIPLRHRQPRAPQAQQNNANVGNLNNNNNDANQAPNNGNINNIGRNEGIGQNQVALGANVPLDHLADAAQGLPAPPAVLPFGAGQAAGLQQHVAGEAGGTAGVGLLAMPLSQQAHEHNASVAASSSSSSMANAHHDFTMSSSQPHISNISLSSSAANPSAVTSGVASHSTTTVQGQGFQTMTTRSEEQQELHPRFDNMHLSETQGSALPASHGSSHPGGTPLTTHKRLAVLPVLIPPVPEGSWLFRSDVLSAITNTVLEPAVAAEESPAAVFEGVKGLAMMTTEQKTCGCNRTYTVSVTGAVPGEEEWKGRDIIMAIHLHGQRSCSAAPMTQPLVHLRTQDAEDLLRSVVCYGENLEDWCARTSKNETTQSPRIVAVAIVVSGIFVLTLLVGIVVVRILWLLMRRNPLKNGVHIHLLLEPKDNRRTISGGGDENHTREDRNGVSGQGGNGRLSADNDGDIFYNVMEEDSPSNLILAAKGEEKKGEKNNDVDMMSTIGHISTMVPQVLYCHTGSVAISDVTLSGFTTSTGTQSRQCTNEHQIIKNDNHASGEEEEQQEAPTIT